MKRRIMVSFIFLLLLMAGKALNGAEMEPISEKGLVAYWNFDEGKGTIIRDLSEKGNDGTTKGGVKWVKGMKGYALEFDGRGSCVDVGNDRSLSITDAITIEVLLKAKGRRDNNIIGNVEGENSYRLRAPNKGGLVMFFTHHTSPGSSLRSNSKLENDKWYSIVVTYDKDGGKNNKKIYIDGKLDVAFTVTGSMDPPTSNFNIGNCWGGYFEGIIDEVKIYNRALSQQEIEEHCKDILQKKQKIFSDKLAKFEKRIQLLPLGAWKKEFELKLSSIKESSPNEQENFISQLSENLNTLEKGKNINIDSIKKGYVSYVVNPTTDYILPDSFLPPKKIPDTIDIVACPKQYASASFVIHAFREIRSLKVESSILKKNEEKVSIPADCVDIRVVKCWYQSGSRNTHRSGSIKFLTPELLLHDDSLINVDYKNKQNYLRLDYPSSEIRYVCISYKAGEQPFLETEAKNFRVKDDSLHLLPLNIPAYTNKQFYITLHVPDNIPPGIYSGNINLKEDGSSLGAIKLRLRVLPFHLIASPLIYSIYYYNALGEDYADWRRKYFKNREQYKKEMENLFAHGVNPTFSFGIPASLGGVKFAFDKKTISSMKEALKIRRQAGMIGQPLYIVKPDGNLNMLCPQSQEDLNILKERVKKIVKIANEYGVPEVYFYGLDEAKGERLVSQRPAWQTIHEAGGKVFVAGYKDKNFEAMGDIQDLLICAHYPSKEEAAKWHSVGHKIFCYCNPQGGLENPEIYRRNFGLLLWKNNYDGAMNFAYQAGSGNTWNDFDSGAARGYNFVYPTSGGVIDTIQWEGFREGINDVRYLTTLLMSIEKAKKSTDKKIKETVLSAEKYLEELKETNLVRRNLDTVRLEMIDYILQLTGGR